MKNKSQQSLEAAQKLIGLRKPLGYNSSIHCSYYAVLQYMKICLLTHGILRYLMNSKIFQVKVLMSTF